MNIAYFAPISYDFLKQRPQYMAEELSKEHKVFYIEPTISLLTTLNNSGLSFKKKNFKESENLEIVRLNGAISLPYKWKLYDYKYFCAYFEFFQITRLIEHIDLIIVAYPGWLDLVSHLRNIPVVYDIMDDYEILTKGNSTKKYIQRCMKYLEKKADCVLVSSIMLFNKICKMRKNVFYVPNALPEQYLEQYVKEKKQDKERLIFTYVGMIAEWFDNDVIEVLAENEKNEIWLVGPISTEKIEKRNVKYFGKVPKEDVGRFLEMSDVCLYPFIKSDFVETINPVKLYEYLAYNKPVIAVRSCETEKFESYIYLYSDINELRAILKNKVNVPFKEKTEYSKFVYENSWNKRVRDVGEIIEKFKGDK